ncbi:MAG: hypothetical protein PUF72_11760 [Clostridiales bacterium]|nr:hypothetical protein [Clostridiales bacterium]
MKASKIIGSLILAAALLAGGYMAGRYTNYESISTAAPKLEKPLPTDESAPENSEAPPPQAAENSDGGLFIGKTNASSVSSEEHLYREFDIKLGERNAKLSLYTSAEYADGVFYWDDSQKWTVEVKDEEGFYPLYSQRVSSGRVYVEAAEPSDGGTVVMVYISTSSGTKINKYTFSKSGFLEKTVYDSGPVNTTVSSIPDYK